MESVSVERERLEIFAKYQSGERVVPTDPWENPSFQEEFARKDGFGFIHDTRITEIPEEKAIKEETERRAKWVKILGYGKSDSKSRKEWSAEFDAHRLMVRSDRIRDLIYKGIPKAVRGEVWQRLLGTARLRFQQPGIYEQMRQRAIRILDIQLASQIDKDVNRCFRNHEMFKDRYSPKQCSLFNVLTAYAVYNTELGYCQGLQCVAALLLMFMDEEDAFWALSQLLTHPKWLLHGFYTTSFPKMNRYTQFLEDRVLRKLLPSLKKHLDQTGYLATMYVPGWFIQLFVCRVPFATVVHFWDILLLEGDKALLWFAYAIMRVRKKQLMNMSLEDLEIFFKQELPNRFELPRDTTLGEVMKDAKTQLERLMAKFKGDAIDWPHQPFGLITPEQAERYARQPADPRLLLQIITQVGQSYVKAQPQPVANGPTNSSKRTPSTSENGKSEPIVISTPVATLPALVSDPAGPTFIRQGSLYENSKAKATAKVEETPEVAGNGDLRGEAVESSDQVWQKRASEEELRLDRLRDAANASSRSDGGAEGQSARRDLSVSVSEAEAEAAEKGSQYDNLHEIAVTRRDPNAHVNVNANGAALRSGFNRKTVPMPNSSGHQNATVFSQNQLII